MEKRKPFRYTGFILDLLNTVAGLAVIILAVLICVNMKEFRTLFPVVFLCAAGMNFLMAIKYMLRREYSKTVFLFIGGMVFALFTMVSVLTI